MKAGGLSRAGNSLFFIGLLALVTAAVVWSASEGEAAPIALAIAIVALLLMGVGGWLWSKPDPNASVPLSRQSPKAKMLAAIPGLIMLFASGRMQSDNKVGQFLGFGLLAYAIVGAVEVFIDRKFPNAKANWDALASWKKFAISIVVIVGSYFLFMFAVMQIAS